MPAPMPLQSGDNIIQTVMTTAADGADYIPLSRPGFIKRLDISNAAAVATANLTVTMAYAPPGSTTYTNITNGAMVIPNATVAGTTTTMFCSPTGVSDGGTIRFTRSGGATGGANLTVSIVVGV